MRSPCRGRLAALLLVLLTALEAACGDPPPPGGSGSLAPAAKGQPDLLVVAGSPYEMGWWQGHLLRDRIRTLHADWGAALLAAVAPESAGSAGGSEIRKGLEAFTELCRDQAEHRLSEAMLQELEGMAAGSGLGKKALMRLEVMRDALRMKGLEPRMVGAGGLLATPGGHETRVWWSGPDAEARAGDLLLVHRKPSDAPETLVVTWPGTVGGLVGLAASGVGYLTAEGEVGQPRRMGFGGGRPLTVAAREALEENDSGYDLYAQVTGTMGHALLAFSMAEEEGEDGPFQRVQAIAGFHIYVAPDMQWVLGRRPFLGIGPYESLEGPSARSVEELSTAPALSADERWTRLRAHAAPGASAPPRGPWARILWSGKAGTLTLRASADGPAREGKIGAR